MSTIILAKKGKQIVFSSPLAPSESETLKKLHLPLLLLFQDFYNVCQVLIAGGAVRTAFPKGKGFIETSMENYLGCIAEVWIALT